MSQKARSANSPTRPVLSPMWRGRISYAALWEFAHRVPKRLNAAGDSSLAWTEKPIFRSRGASRPPCPTICQQHVLAPLVSMHRSMKSPAVMYNSSSSGKMNKD